MRLQKTPFGVFFIFNEKEQSEPEARGECRGVGSLAETSAIGRSADRAGRRDQVLLPLPKNGDFLLLYCSLFTLPLPSVEASDHKRKYCFAPEKYHAERSPVSLNGQ